MARTRVGLLLALLLVTATTRLHAADEQLVRLGDYGRLVADRVIVHKGDRRLELVRNGDVIRTYPIALGRNPFGPKRQAGDGRTPEGRYVLDWRNPNSRFYRSIHISYPNELDRVWAENRGVPAGGMIMIHGTPNNPLVGDYGLKADWTEGCIAVSNAAMAEIWVAVEDGTTIEIRP